MIAYFADYITELVECKFPLYAVDIVSDFGWCCVEILEMEDNTVVITKVINNFNTVVINKVITNFNWIQTR